LPIERRLRRRVVDPADHGHGGVVDQDVEPPASVRDASDHLRGVLRIGLVRTQRLSPTTLREDRVDYCFGLIMGA
jgi:hypothetical protein